MGQITASFTFSPNLQIATEAVTFLGSATPEEGKTIDLWEWKFGNDDIIEGPELNPWEIEYTFPDPGNYNVWMRVTDSEDTQKTIGPVVVTITKKYRVTRLQWTKTGIRFMIITTEYAAGNRAVGVVSREEQGVQNVEDQYVKCAKRIWNEINDDSDIPSAAEVRAGIEAALHELVKEAAE